MATVQVPHPGCTALTIVVSYTNGQSRTIVIREPEEVGTTYAEKDPEVRDEYYDKNLTLIGRTNEATFTLAVKLGEQGMAELVSPVSLIR